MDRHWATLLLYLLLLTTTLLAQRQGSCKGRCGSTDWTAGCSCDSTCTNFGDCCQDFQLNCLTCAGRCGARYDQKQACQCNTKCIQFNNCCKDHESSCQPIVPTGPISTGDLQTFTEELLQKDTNNVASQLRINRQGRTNSKDTEDNAQAPLLTIPASALTGSTIKAFRALLNNYDPKVEVKEIVSNAKTQEQTNFLIEVMKTQVMEHAENFLTARDIIKRPLKDVLNDIWFTLYPRSGSIDGSSGFEHVFIGEIKNEKVSGFHNWIQFGHEEKDGDLDYQGIMQHINLGNKGQIIKGSFNWLNERKSVGSLFVGTSPEFEMALYTVCFLVKPDQKCQVKLNNKKFNIQTWSWTQNLIGSAYPVL